ncbi:hypothetical protein JKF63_05869 [Porcisia hertigi]|uniref:RING-type domain-containing protein n=1 Tax=Porcisia hertigi TaxID=2761500 RepID=A0A836IRG0_9TRYP|nr:hypothetical protein JKF63_05869 [Porcisia hertigi]
MSYQRRRSLPVRLYHVLYEPSSSSSSSDETCTPTDDVIDDTSAPRVSLTYSSIISENPGRDLSAGDLAMHRDFLCYICSEPLYQAMAGGVCGHHVCETCCLNMSVSGTTTCPICGWRGLWAPDAGHSERVRDAVEAGLRERSVALLCAAFPASSSGCIDVVVDTFLDRSSLMVHLQEAWQYFATMPLGGVGVVCTSLNALNAVPDQRVMSSLRVEGSGLTSFEPLRNFIQLQVLVLSGCTDLVSLRGVGGVRLLQRLTVERCDMIETVEIEECRCLRSLQFRDCPQLTHLTGPHTCRGLASFRDTDESPGGYAGLLRVSICGCPAFQRISCAATPLRLAEFRAQCTRFSSLDSLCECRHLEVIDLGGCQQVHCIEPLRRTKLLRYLDLRNTSIAGIDALSQCRELEIVNLSGCSRLRSLDSLMRCTQLRELRASRTGIETLIGLRFCRVLKKVDVSGCTALRDVTALTHLSEVTHVNLSFTAVHDISSLGYYSGLESVSLRGCRHLEDYSPMNTIRAPPPLRFLDLSDTNVCSLSEWGGCPPRLEELRMSGCTRLCDISVLQFARALRVVDLSNTPCPERVAAALGCANVGGASRRRYTLPSRGICPPSHRRAAAAWWALKKSTKTVTAHSTRSTSDSAASLYLCVCVCVCVCVEHTPKFLTVFIQFVFFLKYFFCISFVLFLSVYVALLHFVAFFSFFCILHSCTPSPPPPPFPSPLTAHQTI